ncbi:hypothetical protein FF1_013531 [Malus domestica]
MKSQKVDSATKVALGPVDPSIVTDLSAEKGRSTRTSNCERPTESKDEEFLEVYELLKANLLKDVDAYAKFFDSFGKVVIRSDFFEKRLAYSRRSSLIATMQKTLILAAQSI